MPLDPAYLIFLDFEAQSKADIKKVGTYAYAAHPSTVPLCCAYAFGLGPVQLWAEGQPFPNDLAHPRLGTRFVAWNHETERQILREKFSIYTTNDQWIDPAEWASAAGLPRKLGEVAAALKLPEQKGDNRAMLQVARPRKPTRDNPDHFWRPETRPDLFEKLYTYCKQDVEVMRSLVLKHLPDYTYVFDATEETLADITRRMNTHGITVDFDGVCLAINEAKAHADKLAEEFQNLLPGVNPKSPVVVARTLGLPDVAKATVRDALKDMPDGAHKQALVLLQTLSKSSTKKLQAFRDRVVRGLLHGAMVFHGAGRTGRWSSMGVQLQNMKRGLGGDELEEAFRALHLGIIADLYDNPTDVISDMMRGFLVGPFFTGDWSQIEPRTLMKLTRQLDALERFRKREDPYIALASVIYGKPPEAITKAERFMGKQGVLGCGYGIGAKGFKHTLKETYDIEIPEEEAARVVQAYRRANPMVVAFWWAIERMVKQCIAERWEKFTSSEGTPGISVRMYKSWLVIRLPSGRKLWYYEPALVPDERGFQILYWGRNINKGGAWDRVKTYGGKLTENITQAIARDVMAHGMMNLARAGFKLHFTVHDEIVAGTQGKTLEEFKSLMLQPPSWWPDLPLDVEVAHVPRYQK